MRNFVLILTACAFLASCRAEAQIQSSNDANSTVKIAESTQPQIKSSATSNDINAKIGTVQSGKQSVCLRIENAHLKVGETIQFVTDELPQKFFKAEISEKSPCVEENFGYLDDNGVTDYLLKSADKNFLDKGYAIAVVSTQKIQLKGKFATINLDGDSKPEYFRGCTSMEGLHLTVWSGKPFAGRGIWHAYYGLGYDTVPTCKKRDYDGEND